MFSQWGLGKMTETVPPFLVTDLVEKFKNPVNTAMSIQNFRPSAFRQRQKTDRPSWQRSAVLVGVIEKAGEAHVILTKRTEMLHHHKGQIAFPGGKREKADRSDEDTALREAYEEIGLKRHFFTKLGELDFYYSSTGFEIKPVVGLIGESAQLVKNDDEVDEIFTVPLAFLMDKKNYVVASKMVGIEKHSFYAISYENHYIWGATAGMIRSLAERLTQ